MLTSKERAALRSRANTLDTTLLVGKGGISEELIAETEILLENQELVKGRVLEAALLSAREACDSICDATGAEGVQLIGAKFVIYRPSKKLAAARRAEQPKKKLKNPVRAGIQARRKAEKEEQDRRKKYFHDAAIQKAVAKRKHQEEQ